MAEAEDQTGVSLEDMPLPDEYPEPHTDDKAVVNEVAEREASETAADQSEKGSPNLLQMLKAAENRWTPQGRDKDGPQESQPETGEPVVEAQRTDMVSKVTDQDSVNNMYICKRDPQEAATQAVNDCI